MKIRKIIKLSLKFLFILFILISLYIVFFHNIKNYYWNYIIYNSWDNIDICNWNNCLNWKIKSNIIEGNLMYISFYFPEIYLSENKVFEWLNNTNIWIIGKDWSFNQINKNKIPYYIILNKISNDYMILNFNFQKLNNTNKEIIFDKDKIISEKYLHNDFVYQNFKKELDNSNIFYFWNEKIKTYLSFDKNEKYFSIYKFLLNNN